MESHSEQHFDNLAKKVIKSTKLESPSLDFTANVMASLEGGKSIAYQPLITKKGWLAIAIIILGIVAYPLFGNVEGTGLLENVDYSIISNNVITDALGGIAFSKTLMYCIVILGAFWFIQVQMMKHQIEKRLEF